MSRRLLSVSFLLFPCAVFKVRQVPLALRPPDLSAGTPRIAALQNDTETGIREQSFRLFAGSDFRPLLSRGLPPAFAFALPRPRPWDPARFRALRSP